jgi:hypothetical protein
MLNNVFELDQLKGGNNARAAVLTSAKAGKVGEPGQKITRGAVLGNPSKSHTCPY